MFAIALWDRHCGLLHLVRDRLGEKPLYVARTGSTVVFGSELKALMAHPRFLRRVRAAGVRDVIAHGYVGAGQSIFEDVEQVSPGTVRTFRLCGNALVDEGEMRYWSARTVAPGLRAPEGIAEDEALDELDKRLRAAVELQLQADVPVGVFLSGGIDSSLVSALAVAASGPRVRSYTIAFEDPTHNEAAHAQRVADHLRTHHTVFTVGMNEARDLVPALPALYDEPMADSSQIPTVFLARLARRDVTVALSGDGADEVFGGYPKYRAGLRMWDASARPMRAALAASAMKLAHPVRALAPRALDVRVPWHRLHAAHSLYGARTAVQLARQVGALNRQAERFLAPALRASASATSVEESELELQFRGDYIRSAMLDDLETYLPCDIMTKVDRATMSASLESRAPMLDHRVVEWASGLPTSMLTNDREGKLLLRRLLYRYVPRELVDRPKAGFVVPLASWLRGELRGWAMDTLQTSAARDVIDVPASVALLARHIEGRWDFSARLWPLLTLAAWADRYLRA